MYYYKRRSNPLKWVIIILIFMAIGALIYWFYFNYFSKIDFSRPETAENVTPKDIFTPKILAGEMSLLSGDVLVDISQKGYAKAIDKAVLHQGDKIKTGENSLAVLTIEGGTKIRLGANTEIMLVNLEENNVLIQQLRGRIYNNIPGQGQYQIMALGTKIMALGTKFEVITNDIQEYLAVLVVENKVKLEILDNEEVILSCILNANEKGLVNLKASRKDQFKIDSIDLQILAKEEWYKWNFDLDAGITNETPDLEPDYQEISGSLNLTANENPQGIKLVWTEYNKNDFQAYKIIWSGSNPDLKYPGNEIVKSLTDKTAVEYIDTKIEPDKKYYYRICVVKLSNKVACGNVVEIQTAKKDSIPPASSSLSGLISAAGVSLTWSANNEEDFKEYRVLKSLTDSNPSAPTIGYLVKKYQGSESYLDKEVNITTVGNVYYRVCSLDTAMNFSCSNVIWVENGKIK